MDKLYLFAGINLLLALGVIGTCVCRLGASSAKTVRFTVRVKYVVILTGAAASGLAPLFWSEYPGYGQISLMATLLLSLVVEMRRWRHGAPIDVRTDSEAQELGLPELEKYR